MMEHTREIPGIDPRYQASVEGHIISYMGKKPRQLAGGISKSGLYLTVSVLEDSGRRVNNDVHRLVCKAFHGMPPQEGMQASHLDGNSHNNKPENLAWETPAENSARKLEHGTHDRGYNNSRAVMTPERVATALSMRYAGATQKEIAKVLGVSRTTVLRVINKQRYTNE